jgi:hypothetical protein
MVCKRKRRSDLKEGYDRIKNASFDTTTAESVKFLAKDKPIYLRNKSEKHENAVLRVL